MLSVLSSSVRSSAVARRAVFAVARRSYSSGTGKEEYPEEAVGGKPGTMPSALEQATGPERREYLAALRGEELFPVTNEPNRIHFGTKADPVILYTRLDKRIIGCQGPCPHADEAGWLLWWTQKVNTDKRCGECGQYFSLRPDPTFVHDDHGHGHGHDSHGHDHGHGHGH